MDRREFLGWVGVGSLASFLPLAIAACTPQNKQSETSVEPPRADGFQAAGTVTQLDQQGEILRENLADGPALIIRDPANPQAVVAVNPTCTHAGCTVAWQADQQAFACPCHGSRFAADGQVLQGPATAPLAVYETQLEGDQILIKQG
ncbi:MAG: cytochrome b6-f complex iron-sulfur subunit [Elainellaceae cyanobacterium]